MKVTPYLLGCTLVAALGGFLFGFDTAVISGTTSALRSVFSLTQGQLGFTAASAILGTIIGALAVGPPAEALGRKPVLLGLAVLYFLSAVGCGLAWDWYALLVFRFLGGLAIGGASVASPMYIAEISPPEARGRLVAVSQLNIVCGVLAAYFSNYLISAHFTDAVASAGAASVAWRYMLGVVAIPSALFFLLLLPIPESPRWLVKRHRRQEAGEVLRKAGTGNVPQVLAEIVESLHEETIGASEPFFQRKYLVPILLALMVGTFNQLSGINAFTYYTADVFKMAGAARQSALAQAVVLGLTNLVFTVLAMSVIDRFGRRSLLLIGSVGMAACLAATAFAFHVIEQLRAGAAPVAAAHQAQIGWLVLASLIGYYAFFAFSQGSVVWVFLSEIFPNRVRARGQALGSFSVWFWCAVVTWTFPIIADRSGSLAFAFFAAMMVLQLLLVWKFLPETKGVSLEEIQRTLGIE